MRRIFRTISILLLCGSMSCQMMDARGRNNGNNGNGQRPAASAQRPGNNGHNNNGNHGNNGHGRPNHGFNNSISSARPQGPGGPGGGPGFNPGGGPGGPGNGGPGFNPGNNRPGNPNPGLGFGPANRPSFGFPNSPNIPASRPWTRPTPPSPGYTVFSGPSISTILGVALGTTINYALNSLINSGYSVASYTNNNIYLNDVVQLNMMWPTATMHYNNGSLVGSEFFYSTPYYDLSRYNAAYSMLTSTYGLPYSNNSNTATWWGPNGQFITLQYAPATTASGLLRYYTTLTFGN